MAHYDLNRAQDTPIATLKVADIVPKNWHRFPPRVASMTKPNPNEAKPRYLGAGATADWQGGDRGDDVDEASANVVKVDANNTTIPNYSPRNQEEVATKWGTTMAPDISRPRGTIDPREPYPTVGFTPVEDPVLTTVTPSTAVAGTQKITALVVGTGFTQWTQLRVGGQSRLSLTSEYISPTLMNVLVDPSQAPAATYKLQAVDHDVESNELDFILT